MWWWVTTGASVVSALALAGGADFAVVDSSAASAGVASSSAASSGSVFMGTPGGRRMRSWRREWDSNPRGGISAYTISNRAPSTARTSLRNELRDRMTTLWPDVRLPTVGAKTLAREDYPPHE